MSKQFKAIFILSLLALNSECARVSINKITHINHNELDLDKSGRNACSDLEGEVARLCEYISSKVNKVETKGVTGAYGAARISKLGQQAAALAAAIKSFQEKGCEEDLSAASAQLASASANLLPSGGETASTLSTATSQDEAELAKTTAPRNIAQMAQELAQMAQEHRPDVPTSSSECLMLGVPGKSKCQPEQYCYFERGWSNLGGLRRDQSCHLKWLYKSDEKLAKSFGIASAKLILKSEEFRTSGSIRHLWQLNDYYRDFGKCANAASSELPTHKTYLNRLKTAFQDKQITLQQYATSVDEVARQIPGWLNKFNVEGLSKEALETNALERTVKNLDLGFKKKNLGPLSTFATKVDLMELMKVNAADTDHATIAAQVKKVVPSLSQAQLDTVLSDAVAKKDAELQECNNDYECMSGRTEAGIEAMSEDLSKVADKSINAILEYAESKNLTQAKHDEDPHERRDRAFSFLEEHMESVEGEPSEHGKELPLEQHVESVEGEPSEHGKLHPCEVAFMVHMFLFLLATILALVVTFLTVAVGIAIIMAVYIIILGVGFGAGLSPFTVMTCGAIVGF